MSKNANTHRDLSKIDVTCSGCSRKFDIHSTITETTTVNVEMCSKCHPAYTGEQKVIITKAIDSFNRRFSAFATQADDKKDAPES